MLGVGDGREQVGDGRGEVLQVRGQPAEGTELLQKAPLLGPSVGVMGRGLASPQQVF